MSNLLRLQMATRLREDRVANEKLPSLALVFQGQIGQKVRLKANLHKLFQMLQSEDQWLIWKEILLRLVNDKESRLSESPQVTVAGRYHFPRVYDTLHNHIKMSSIRVGERGYSHI